MAADFQIRRNRAIVSTAIVLILLLPTPTLAKPQVNLGKKGLSFESPLSCVYISRIFFVWEFDFLLVVTSLRDWWKNYSSQILNALKSTFVWPENRTKNGEICRAWQGVTFTKKVSFFNILVLYVRRWKRSLLAQEKALKTQLERQNCTSHAEFQFVFQRRFFSFFVKTSKYLAKSFMKVGADYSFEHRPKKSQLSPLLMNFN